MRFAYVRVHRPIPLERRQLGIVGGVVAGVLNPILGGPTTTQPQPVPQPPQTSTTTGGGGGGGGRPISTTTPSPAGHTANPANGGGGPTSPPNPGIGGGNNGNNDNAPGGRAGPSTAGSPTGTLSSPSRPSISASGNRGGTSGNTSSGGTTSGTNGDPSMGSDSGREPDSVTGGGSSGSPNEGPSYSSSGSGSGSGSGSDSGNGGPISPSPSDIKTLGDKGKNSKGGAIAAAVILAILFGIAVVIFILRRRSKARRDDQTNKWWFTRKRTSQTYGDDEALHNGVSSRRSSFGTTVDHSILVNTAIPPPPPMAEVGRSNGTAPSLVLDINADHRFSIGSASSHNSQFLIILHRESLLQEAMNSARTESFPFPKPPVGDRASLHSKASWRSQSELNQDRDVFGISPPPSPSQLIQSDPFADNNPFENPSSAPSPIPDQNVTGTVYRPFSPQLQDELQVDIGESVRILESFDDGWAFAEKMDTSRGNGGQGFVPLECFQEFGQSLSGKTRSSSHGTESV